MDVAIGIGDHVGPLPVLADEVYRVVPQRSAVTEQPEVRHPIPHRDKLEGGARRPPCSLKVPAAHDTDDRLGKAPRQDLQGSGLGQRANGGLGLSTGAVNALFLAVVVGLVAYLSALEHTADTTHDSSVSQG